MNGPNFLTILRIFFVPLLVAALVQDDWSLQLGGAVLTNEWLALAIFLIAAFTDLLDGYLARRWSQVTTIGTLLDPIADKLLVLAALIALVQVRAVPAWMVILILGREFAVSGLRSIAASAGYVIEASDLGKTKMVMQVVAISFLLVGMRHPWAHDVAIPLMWVVIAVTMGSAVDYFRKFWRKVDERVKLRRRRELLQLERKRQRATLDQIKAARKQAASAAAARSEIPPA